MSRQNVLLIVVDQWRADFVPHLLRAEGGEPFLKTPNLDRRLTHADRTLTQFRSTPQGLESRISADALV